MNSCRSLADCHVHSTFSYDGKATIEASCEAGFRAGLSLITITDHCDIRTHRNGHICYFPKLEQRQQSIMQEKEHWNGRLGVLNGLELGDVYNDTALAKAHLQACSYDFVLGSVHHPRERDTISLEDMSPKDRLIYYFDLIEALLDFGNFDSLAHLCYPIGYWQAPEETFFLFRERIRHILTRTAQDGHALEINTSGKRKGFAIEPMLWLLQEFRSVGGAHITLGSDAHYAADVAADFPEAVAMVRRAGFDSIVYYQERKPHKILI